MLKSVKEMIEDRDSYEDVHGTLPGNPVIEIDYIQEDAIFLFIWGGGVILHEDGTWSLYDTSGG